MLTYILNNYCITMDICMMTYVPISTNNDFKTFGLLLKVDHLPIFHTIILLISGQVL